MNEDVLNSGALVFEPATLALVLPTWTSDSWNEEQQAIRDAITQSPDDAPLNDSLRDFGAVLFHEHDHLARIVATPYGLFRHHLETSWLACAEMLITEPSEGASPHHRPVFREEHLSGVFDKMLRFVGELPAFLQSLTPQEFLTFLSGTSMYLLKSLNGQLPFKDMVFAQIHMTYEALRTPHYDGGNVVEYDLALPEGLRENNCSAPIVMADAPLTTHHILETLGLWAQARAVLTQRSSKEWRTLISNHNYSRAVYTWCAVTEGSLFTDAEAVRSAYYPWSLLPFELLAAADLALWVPFSPRGFVVKRQPFRWHEMSPPWRFLCIAGLVAASGSKHGRVPNSGGSELLVELQNGWCNSLGWPTPSELLELWLEAPPPSTGLPIELRQPWRYRAMRAVLEERRKRPLDVALSAGDVDLDFPIGVTCSTKRDHSFTVNGWGDGSDKDYWHQMMWYFRYKIARRLMFGSHAAVQYNRHHADEIVMLCRAFRMSESDARSTFINWA